MSGTQVEKFENEIGSDELIGIQCDFQELVEDFVNKCGYSQKDAREAAQNVIMEDYGL